MKKYTVPVGQMLKITIYPQGLTKENIKELDCWVQYQKRNRIYYFNGKHWKLDSVMPFQFFKNAKNTTHYTTKDGFATLVYKNHEGRCVFLQECRISTCGLKWVSSTYFGDE